MHQAALKGNVISGTFLLEFGADLHFISRQGDTPLHYAVMSGQEKMVSEEIRKKRQENCSNIRFSLLHPLFYPP